MSAQFEAPSADTVRAGLQVRLVSNAHRLERLADDRDLPGFYRSAYRDLAAKCRAEAASLSSVAA